jgi:hypothetical protein|nr:MAG TPA: hypothetical protein [Caudoviricetes sp.]
MTEDDFNRLQVGAPVHWDARGINGTVADILHGYFDKSILIKSGDALIWASYRNVEKGEKHYEHKRRTYRKKGKHAAGRER